MAVITNEQIKSVNSKCSNDWKLDVQYYIYHNEKTLIKRITLDEQNFLEFALRYNYKNQISLHISKFFQETGKKYASTSGMGKSVILDEIQAKRKSVNNLIAFTEKLTDTELLDINENTKVSTGYGLIMQSEDF